MKKKNLKRNEAKKLNKLILKNSNRMKYGKNSFGISEIYDRVVCEMESGFT